MGAAEIVGVCMRTVKMLESHMHDMQVMGMGWLGCHVGYLGSQIPAKST
jgi:hypothetical protein